MIRVLAASFLLLLAACNRAPEAERSAEPLAARFTAPDGWTWGLVQPKGEKALRYGVGSPPRVPLATVVIVPPVGESSEVWLETARNLISDGANVWLLDRSPGGIDADVAALRGLVSAVVRPDGRHPLILLGQGDGAVVALTAVKNGLPADGLILSAPDAQAAPARDEWRRAALAHWPLREEPPRDWKRRLREARRELDEPPHPKTPTLVLSPGAAEPPLCRKLLACRSVQFPGAQEALHLEQDRWRAAWLAAVLRFVEERVTAQRAAQIAPIK